MTVQNELPFKFFLFSTFSPFSHFVLSTIVNPNGLSSMSFPYFEYLKKLMLLSIETLSWIETIRILGKRLQKAVDSLAVLFGKPSFETLTKELEPLSERYDYVFRMNHVENMIRSLS